MSQDFEFKEDFPGLIKINVMVETISYAGSGFAITKEGDQVFINKRIVELMGLDEGMVVEAMVIPNYEDKRDKIQWRAIRIVPKGDSDPVPEQAPVDKAKLIQTLIDEEGPLRTATIAKHLSMSVDEVTTICLGLFAEKRLAMAEVYGEPGQKRASIRVWGVDINDFDVNLEDAH